MAAGVASSLWLAPWLGAGVGAEIAEEGVELDAVEGDRARGGRQELGQQVEAGGLAGAVRAKQADALAGRDVEREVGDDFPVLVAFLQVSCAEHQDFGASVAGLAAFGFGAMVMLTRPPGSPGPSSSPWGPRGTPGKGRPPIHGLPSWV